MISEHLKTKFLLWSMPEPLDNASNSFPKKLKILDRTLSSQNMRGQTAHNRPSSSNPFGEKGDILCLRQASCVYVPTLTSSVRHPMTHLLPSDLYLWCSTWMGLNRYFHHLFTWWNCLSLYLWTLSAEKSCGSDYMIRNQKSGWTLHWILHPHANLFSDQCLMVHGLYIYRLSLALYPGSLSTKLCSHIWNSLRLHNAKPSPTISLRASTLLLLIYILVDVIHETRLVVYASDIMVVMGPAFIIYLLFQTGGCFTQVILHIISTTGTRSSGRNKQEVAVFNIQWPL